MEETCVTYKVTVTVRKMLERESETSIPMAMLGEEFTTYYSTFDVPQDWVDRLAPSVLHTLILEEVKTGLPELVGLMKMDAKRG